MLLLNTISIAMDVLNLSYKVKIFHNQVLEAVCKQQFEMKYTNILHVKNERKRLLLANSKVIAHKKANKVDNMVLN
jgi:hypothetical protein